jgi:UDP-N-acetylmuramyl tripeptide synthase
MTQIPIILLGKIISQTSTLLNRGNGSTWPGHIALKTNPQFIKDILKQTTMKIIIVAGTNGKTTTASIITTTLEKNGKHVLQNESGANLLNGIASTLLLKSTRTGKLPYDFAIFEVDENALPQVLKQITPDYLLLLNLFRDQLDRYGEINTIAEKWHQAIQTLPKQTKLILNADDPQIAAFGIDNKNTTHYFSVKTSQKSPDKHQAADATTCPACGNTLTFTSRIYAHLGNWHCTQCGLQRPTSDRDTFAIYPLTGTYNRYNTHAAVLVLQKIGLTTTQITKAFHSFTPVFGRQEIISYHNRNVQIFLSKNPTSFNQSYKTILELGIKHLFVILNDRIPDGRDVSWIWDTDLSEINSFHHITLSGDRAYDMGLRFHYADCKDHVTVEPVLETALEKAINTTPLGQTLAILPTYSAMLDVRKIITGKKIL